MESMPYWNPFETKDLVQFAMQGEKLAVATMLTMLPCPLGGFTLVSYSLDIIKIESPSELYATVVHPQIELKTSDAFRIKANGFSQKRNYAMKCGRTMQDYIPKITT
jgi:homoserine kinase